MSKLDRVIELSREIQEQVDRGNWIEAGALNTERHRLLTEICDDGGIDRLGPGARAALQEILARNRVLTRTVHAQKKDLTRERSRLRAGEAATRNYRMNAPPQKAPAGTVPEEV